MINHSLPLTGQRRQEGREGGAKSQATLIEHLLCAGHSITYLLYFILLSSYDKSIRWVALSHFTYKATEPQRGQITG